MIDKHKWEKLTNRRVQHYGYEFIYGANVVNKHNKIGDMPDFCDGLMQSKYRNRFYEIYFIQSIFIKLFILILF
jgi:hypothetical protein